MNQTELQDKAQLLRSLHRGRILVLPNAWDAGSARMIERAGAAAIATTSCGISWALGLQDGQHLTRAQMLKEIRRIVNAVSLPVTADIEGGYGVSTQDVSDTVKGLIEVGAVGFNLEDSGNGGDPLLSLNLQVERLRAARVAALELNVNVVMNARTDVYLSGWGQTPEQRLEETVRRANAYLAAGADCVFVPGVTDAVTIQSLVEGIQGPLNIMAFADSPPVSELEGFGVARVSLGSVLAQAAYALAQQIAQEALNSGRFEVFAELRNGETFRKINSLMDGGLNG
jgi:2-methylisocitrate lyase-like PEP mutase family enzyme